MKNKLFKFMSNNNIKILIISLLVLFMILPIFKKNNKNVNLFTMINNKLFDSNYTEEIESIEIESPDYIDMEPGSWHIDKSARWTGIDTAQVTFDVSSVIKPDDNYKDIILVIDTSGSMSGTKLDRLKEDAIDLTYFLLSEPNNRIAIIEFNDYSQILLDFSNDIDSVIDSIFSLQASGLTNYNAALNSVEYLMDDYINTTPRSITTLFLTDGTPCVDTPSQIGVYELLKGKYPYMTINGIQYDMGSEIKSELKEVSDAQWTADIETLNNVLFEASATSLKYETFEVVDYIDKDYFTLNSVDDIEVTAGTVKLEEEDGLQKITWILNNLYLTGSRQVMNINLSLNEQYVKKEGYYPTNKKEEVKYKLDQDTKIVKSNQTPVLRNVYNLIYKPNAPQGCNRRNKTESYYVYDNVTLNLEELSCDGYIFKGWEIITDVKKINDDTFVMPENNVIIMGTWAKPTLTKTMDGKIHKLVDLYKVMQKDANENNNAAEYTGDVTDTYDMHGDEKIYYYKGENPNNNVIFANYCWQMVRTTATGGIKMIYNGIPKDGKCNNSGEATLIGHSKFAPSYLSPAFVGYMYDKVYNVYSGRATSTTLFAKDVEYDGEKYTLIDTTNKLDSTHHYSCGFSVETCKNVQYYYSVSFSIYISMDGQRNINELFNNIFYGDDVNKNDSTIKSYIESWYENNMVDYSDYLEDTVFCNDRSVDNYEESGWNPNGGSRPLYFSAYTRVTPTLKCSNITDRFSMANNKAKIKYPVGLLSADEALLGKSKNRNQAENYYLKNGSIHWLNSPESIYNDLTMVQYVGVDGKLNYSKVNSAFGVRPVISLKQGTIYSDGEGTKDNPYVVETN